MPIGEKMLIFSNEFRFLKIQHRGWCKNPSRNGALAYAPLKIRADKGVVLDAVKRDGMTLVCASSELRND